MKNRFRTFLASRKGFDPERLAEWTTRNLLSFIWLMVCRLMRGWFVAARMKSASGMVLCEKRVRIYHAGCFSAGKQLNIEEGAEVVALSKRGVTLGDRCTIGRYACIRPTNVLLDEPGEGLVMGDHSNIGAYSYVGCSGYIEIGNQVMMGPHVYLLAENHNFTRTDIPMKDQGVSRSTIIIEDDCWIGSNVTILAGVTVGAGSIVAAGAVVTKDVPPFSVVGGVPAKVISSRKSEGV